jgi:hypothetical protein
MFLGLDGVHGFQRFSPVIKQIGSHDLTISRLQPYAHYVPMAEDLSNVPEAVHWVLDHPGDTQKIVKAANMKMLEMSKREYLTKYWKQMLHMYF